MRGPKALWVTLAMAATLVALAFALPGPLARRMAEHWRNQLDSVPDEHAEALLRQAATLGETGVSVLVEALGSPRESVAQAGKRVLVEQFELWKGLPFADRSRRLALLAEALAARVERFGPTARADASELATRVLLWPLDRQAVDRARVIGCCEKVFAATAGDGGMLTGIAAPRGPLSGVEPSGSSDRPQDADHDLGPPDLAVDALSRLPGGGLPMESLPIAALPAGTLSGAELSAQEGERLGMAGAESPPGPLPDATAAHPLRPSGQPHQGGSPRDETPEVADRSSGRSSTPDAVTVRPMSFDVADAGRRNGAGSDLSKTQTLDLMRRLQGGDADAVAEVETELARRGFAGTHLQLARCLFDPDPTVRRELARRLPQLPGVDAVPWLTWLCRDADSDVRLTAITLMATTSDPTLIEQAARIAREDSDPRIQQQAQRMTQLPGNGSRLADPPRRRGERR